MGLVVVWERWECKRWEVTRLLNQWAIAIVISPFLLLQTEMDIFSSESLVQAISLCFKRQPDWRTGQAGQQLMNASFKNATVSEISAVLHCRTAPR